MAVNQVRVAAAQIAPVFMDRDATVAKVVATIDECGRNGADVVGFGETLVPGYPMWIYGAAGWDDPVTKRVFAQLQENSVEVPSPATDRLCDAARRAGTMVVVGINERDTEFSRGTLYNSLLFISAEGEIMGVRRKLMPTHAERIVWGQGDGSSLQVYDSPVGRIGGSICWEHWMPLNRFVMHAKGEQIHVAAWPEVPDIHHVASRHYAFEGRCFVICVGSYMTMDHVAANFELRSVLAAAGQFSANPDEILPGGSGIIGPDGNWIAGPVAGREEVVYADVDLSAVGGEQMAFDAAGHYNRPDIFSLQVDERRRDQFTSRPLDEPDPSRKDPV
jgi:nitrilase